MGSTVPQASIRTSVQLPMRFSDGYRTIGEVMTFDGLFDGREHVAIRLGHRGTGRFEQPDEGFVPLVRPHSECLTGETFGSERCDCGPQFREAVERIAACGGYLLYLRQEGRGIGLYRKIDAYALQEAGLDTFDANLALGRAEDERDYTVAVQMLIALGARSVRLLTNNPDKVTQLSAGGIDVVEQVPTGTHATPANTRYLDAKARRHARMLGAV